MTSNTAPSIDRVHSLGSGPPGFVLRGSFLMWRLEGLAQDQLSNVLWGVRYPTDTPWGLGGRFVYLRLSHGLAP